MTSERLDYISWQECLATHLLDLIATAGQRPITLFVDDDFLQRLPPGFDAISLGASVRECLEAPGQGMFRPILRRAMQWRQQVGDTPPPTLPLLAVMVLAASHMDRDGQTWASNYYLPLAQVLAPTERAIPKWKAALSAHCDDVVPLWYDLRDWINGNGGTSTIRDHPHFTRIGFALSQAVVRAIDRRVLTQFWSALDVQGIGVPAPQEIVRDLRRWVRGNSRGLSPELLRRLASDQEADWLGLSLTHIAESWDGAVKTAEGSRLIDLELTATAGSSGIASLTLRWVPASGGQVSSPFAVGDLENGRSVREADAIYRVSPHQCVLLGYDGDGWREVRELHLGEPYYIVLRPALRAAGNDFVAAVKTSGKPVEKAIFGGALVARIPPIVDGHALLDAATAFKEATGVDLLGAIQGDASVRARLSSGLRVDSALGNRFYVTGGAPDLRIPSAQEGGDEGSVDVAVDGVSQHLQRSGYPVPLRATFTEPGSYEGTADGSTFRFEVVADGRDVSARPIRDRVSWDRGQWWPHVGDTNDGVTGALCPGKPCGEDVRSVWVPRAAAETYLVGPGGQARRLQQPPDSALWDTLFPSEGDVPPRLFTVQRSRTEGWLVQRWPHSWTARQLVPVPADQPPDGDTDPALWQTLLRACADRPAGVPKTAEWDALLVSAGILEDKR